MSTVFFCFFFEKIVSGLINAIHQGTLCDYLTFRDDSRADRGATPRWTDTTAPFAAKAWQLSTRGIAQRGSKVRHLWDLRWHGENQAVTPPARSLIYYVIALA